MKHALSRAPQPSTPAPSEIYNFRVYVLAIVASMGAFLFGYDLAFIGSTITLKPFVKDFGLAKLSKSQQDAFAANIVSLLQAGCFFGSLLAAPISDKYGRKIVLSAAGLIFCIGSAMQTASHGSRGLMFAGRTIGGLGVGAASMLVPTYIAEMSPPSIRGRLVGIYEIGVQIGVCIGFWINFGVQQNIAPTSKQWITPFAVQLFPGGLLTIGMFFLLESPRWVARTKGHDASIEVLSRLRGLPAEHPYLVEEADAISHQIEEERIQTSGKGLLVEFRELCRPGNRRRITLGVLIFVFMQMAGSNAINYYSPRIFASIGLQGQTVSLISTGVYGIVRLVAVIIAMYFLVDRVGRTRLLLIGSIGMAICMYYIGAYVTVHPSSQSTAAHTNSATKQQHLGAGGIASAVMLYIYAVFFSISWAGVPWIYTSEIFPTRIRSLAVSICVATHWLFNFVIARSVPYMVSNIGGGMYFVFAACLTVSVPFVWFFLPETKGCSLEEMDQIFMRRKGSADAGGVCEVSSAGGSSIDVEKASVSVVERV